jgi:hypothetical protein
MRLLAKGADRGLVQLYPGPSRAVVSKSVSKIRQHTGGQHVITRVSDPRSVERGVWHVRGTSGPRSQGLAVLVYVEVHADRYQEGQGFSVEVPA